MINLLDYSDALQTKIIFVSKSKNNQSRVITEAELNEIESSSNWFDGWLYGCNNAQVVTSKNKKGQLIIRAI